MPNYRTHSIHGEIVLPNINKRIEINKEDMKSFCMGPDSLIITDYKLFEYQHHNKTKEYFLELIRLIKEYKLYDNSEVMAFLYGQLDHFVLDVIMHPLIIYMTEDLPKTKKMNPHAIVENWIDDYVIYKNNDDKVYYYNKKFIKDIELLRLIDKLYKKVYNKNNEGFKYSLGMFYLILYDVLIRRNKILISPLLLEKLNIGDIKYSKDFNRVIPFLNLDKDIWTNPETGIISRESFNDLWEKSINVSLEVIDDVNKTIYKNNKLDNKIILNDTSFTTGLPCNSGKTMKYVKKYTK